MRLLKVTIYIAAFFMVHACESRVFQSHTLAQTTSATDRPQFEVVSVKPNTSTGDGPRGISFSPSGRFAWNWMTVKQLMSSAYAELEFKQIVGGPSWTDTDRFDIVATSPDALKEMNPDGAPRGLFRRLRTLLEDRFQLKTHIENREIALFALEPASTPMRVGRALRRTDIDCELVMREMAAGRRPEVPHGQTPPCALAVRPGQLNGHAISMGQLISAISGPAGRPVVDRTGLAGTFDVELKWAAELPPGAQLNGAPAPPSDGPSLFTALREQLGLKLEATRASVPVLVIDSAQRPSPD
jgi:uncharacterized protein (TIGR03435 family)